MPDQELHDELVQDQIRPENQQDESHVWPWRIPMGRGSEDKMIP